MLKLAIIVSVLFEITGCLPVGGLDFEKLGWKEAESTFAFENGDSRYDNWHILPYRAECQRNMTMCSVMARTVDGILVRNFDENGRMVYHLVTDRKFKCHTDVEWHGENCLYRDSKFGRLQRINPECGISTFECEFLELECPEMVVGLSKVFFDGSCIIKLDKAPVVRVFLETPIQNKVCYEIYVDGELYREGYVSQRSPVSLTIDLPIGEHIIKASCGANDFSTILRLGKFPRCVMWLTKLGVPEGFAKFLCEYFYFFRVALISICITAVFCLIHSLGFGKLLVPLYALALLPFILIQKVLARKKICTVCASRLYWLVPHKPFCSMSCKRCGVYAADDFSSLLRHKEKCENIHNPISTTEALKFMISRKFFYRLSKIISVILIIWAVSHFNVAAAEQPLSISGVTSVVFNENPGKIEGVRGGDIINVPKAETINIFGGAGTLEIDGAGVRTLLGKTTGTFEKLSLGFREGASAYSSHENAENLVNRLSGSLAQLGYTISKNAEDLSSEARKSAERASGLIGAVQAASGKLAAYQDSVNKTLDAVNRQIQITEEQIRQHQEWLNREYKKDPATLTEKQRQEISRVEKQTTALQDNLAAEKRKIAYVSSPTRHRRSLSNYSPVKKVSKEQSIKVLETAKDFYHAHSMLTTSANSPRLATVKAVDPKYATRRFFHQDDCSPNDIWIDTFSQGELSSTVNVKLQATFPIAAGSCSVFNLKFKDDTIKDTELVIRIMQTSITWPVLYLYSAFRTVSYDVIPHELCVEGVDSCIANLKKWNSAFLKKGGLIKAWSDCQSWGCEFPGCAVVHGGCCAIICRDVPDPKSEIKVYQLLPPIFNVELCIHIPGHEDCIQVSSVSGAETKSFRFENVFTVLRSEFARDMKVAVPAGTHTVYKGSICGQAEYCEGFGALQFMNGTMHGKPEIIAYTSCNGISFKSFQVDSCYLNTYDKFANLKQVDPVHAYLLNADGQEFVSERDLYMGQMTWQANLKNVIITRKDLKPVVKAKILNCTGCYKCLQQAMCLLKIDSSKTFSGRIWCLDVFADQNLFAISAGEHEYRTVIDSRSPFPDLNCFVMFETEKFKIEKPAVAPHLYPGNITWDDDAIDPIHKDVTDHSSTMFDWKWFNPFSLFGWNSYFAIFKVVVLGLLIFAALFCVLFVFKYFRMLGSFISEIADIAGAGTVKAKFKGFKPALSKSAITKYYN